MERLGTGVATHGVLAQRQSQHPVDGQRQRLPAGQLGDPLGPVGVPHRFERGAAERRVAGRRGPQQAAQGVDVGSRRRAGERLRRCVRRVRPDRWVGGTRIARRRRRPAGGSRRRGGSRRERRRRRLVGEGPGDVGDRLDRRAQPERTRSHGAAGPGRSRRPARGGGGRAEAEAVERGRRSAEARPWQRRHRPARGAPRPHGSRGAPTSGASARAPTSSAGRAAPWPPAPSARGRWSRRR